MNLPNRLTLLRIALIPVCLACWSMGWHIAAAAVFVLAAVTDFLDGYLARKHRLVTTFGKFADPVADKVLVLTCIIFLCADARLSPWVAGIVAARELMVDGLRMVAAEKGKVIAAGMLGKIKTNTQLVCVLCAMLLPQGCWPVVVLEVIMAAMTLVSGISYFLASRDVFRDEKEASE